MRVRYEDFFREYRSFLVSLLLSLPCVTGRPPFFCRLSLRPVIEWVDVSGSGRTKDDERKMRLRKRKRKEGTNHTFRLVRDDESLGQEVVPEGVGGRGGREGEDAFLAVTQEEMDGQAPALTGGAGSRFAEKG